MMMQIDVLATVCALGVLFLEAMVLGWRESSLRRLIAGWIPSVGTRRAILASVWRGMSVLEPEVWMTAMLIIGFWPLLVTNAQSLGRLARVAVAATAPAQA